VDVALSVRQCAIFCGVEMTAIAFVDFPGLLKAGHATQRRCSAVAKWTQGVGAAYLKARQRMRSFNFVVERDPDTGLFVGYVPGWPGAHSQGDSLDELQRNLQEVVGMLLEDGEPTLESEFVGVQTIRVG
jgi:predicted RNase H-like HicB family nuclease